MGAEVQTAGGIGLATSKHIMAYLLSDWRLQTILFFRDNHPKYNWK
jgi:hypothetical protein